MSATILVVDDNEMNRDVLSRRLERQGFKVVIASGGREALELIETVHFDLCLFDIMMPEVSGLDALAVIIMVTAKTQREDVVAALEMGANDYVTKPVDFPVLLARVRTHLELHRLSALKDEFLAIASHDLKNPLTEVLGVASLVEVMVPPGTPMPQKLHHLVSNMKKSARRMQAIIEDFLDFQALENNALELAHDQVDLVEIMREVVSSNDTYAAQKAVRLEVDFEADLPVVPGDKARLSQVMQNLVDNALKYGLPYGVCTIAIKRDGEQVRVEVRDCGPGLQEADQTRVFDKFVRVGSVPTGGEKSSGVGLNICKQLIELHGGAIGVHNSVGGGATFWFTLPQSSLATLGVPT
jgi:two-component system sensor histidine kinase/response regulator